jgi:hypothetical protein
MEPAMAGFHALAVEAFESDAASQCCCAQTLAVSLLSMAQGPLLLWEGGNTKVLLQNAGRAGVVEVSRPAETTKKFQSMINFEMRDTFATGTVETSNGSSSDFSLQTKLKAVNAIVVASTKPLKKVASRSVMHNWAPGC